MKSNRDPRVVARARRLSYLRKQAEQARKADATKTGPTVGQRSALYERMLRNEER